MKVAVKFTQPAGDDSATHCVICRKGHTQFSDQTDYRNGKLPDKIKFWSNKEDTTSNASRHLKNLCKLGLRPRLRLNNEVWSFYRVNYFLEFSMNDVPLI